MNLSRSMRPRYNYGCSVAGSGINNQCSRDGDVRLEGGSHQYEGRVQVCEGGEWTYICILIPGIHWSNSHGEVACRSLNYSTDSKVSISA